jgi:hypothetical protein
LNFNPSSDAKGRCYDVGMPMQVNFALFNRWSELMAAFGVEMLSPFA